MVPVPLSAGSEPATILASHFDDSKLHPWLEYSVWQERSGCGYTLQDSLNDGTAVTPYLIYLKILFGNGSG